MRGALGATLAAAVALGGCAAADKRACTGGDWEGLGRADGAAGLGYERLGALAERCSDYDIAVDAGAWNAGYAAGIERYCEPERGFDLGERGALYSGNCPAPLERAYLASHVRGLELRRDELELAHDRLRVALEDARRERAALDPEEDSPEKLERRIESLAAELEANLGERREINRRIGRWSRGL